MNVSELLEYFLHPQHHLHYLTAWMGPWFYLLLFAVVFCETGLVVTPLLPGDSLLFAVGALAAGAASPLNVPLLFGLLVAAAVLGDAVNYAIGCRLGPKVFKYEHTWFFNKKHLLRAQTFYEKYGGKTIILARFVPIVRTFAPFVAGIGVMRYPRFASTIAPAPWPGWRSAWEAATSLVLCRGLPSISSWWCWPSCSFPCCRWLLRACWRGGSMQLWQRLHP
jgi:membrane-associated protein